MGQVDAYDGPYLERGPWGIWLCLYKEEFLAARERITLAIGVVSFVFANALGHTYHINDTTTMFFFFQRLELSLRGHHRLWTGWNGSRERVLEWKNKRCALQSLSSGVYGIISRGFTCFVGKYPNEAEPMHLDLLHIEMCFDCVTGAAT
jgi:hypothetical protein